jgi:lactate dehydrogenase-like 2-hydroxyacid dehydrogenase
VGKRLGGRAAERRRGERSRARHRRVDELVSGRLRAGLDVFAEEPDVPRALFDLDNVVLTPHLGTATQATREAMTRVLVDNLLAVERGEDPPNAV